MGSLVSYHTPQYIHIERVVCLNTYACASGPIHDACKLLLGELRFICLYKYTLIDLSSVSIHALYILFKLYYDPSSSFFRKNKINIKKRNSQRVQCFGASVIVMPNEMVMRVLSLAWPGISNPMQCQLTSYIIYGVCQKKTLYNI